MQLRDINHYDKYSFGRYIKQKREKQGITLRRLASELRMTHAYLSGIENGNRHAPLYNKNYMIGLIKNLCIGADEIDMFSLMAIATREFDFSYLEYNNIMKENSCIEK